MHVTCSQVKLTDDARASLLHARVGVVASGTATVEAALIGTPFVMVYRVAGLTWTLGRHLVKLPYYGMVNLVAGREVVPELIQQRFTPESVEREVRALLEDGRGEAAHDGSSGGGTRQVARRAGRRAHFGPGRRNYRASGGARGIACCGKCSQAERISAHL